MEGPMGKKQQTEWNKREAALLWRIEQMQKNIQRLLALMRVYIPKPYTFKKTGNIWIISFGHKMGSFSDLKGFEFLHRLLSNPDKQIPATALVAASTSRNGDGRFATEDEMSDRLVSGQDGPQAAGSSGFEGGNHQAICDPQASAEIGKRIRSLQKEMEQMKIAGADAEYGRLQSELDALENQRGKDTFMGRSRSFTNIEKKAAQNVHHRLTAAYTAMAEGNPPMTELVKYLRNTVFNESNQYVYRPTKRLDWSL